MRVLLTLTYTWTNGGESPQGSGYSLYSDDRDDRRIFRGYNRRFSILGAVQAKSIKKINWYLLGYKNRSFEYAALINSGLLLFFKVNF